MMDRLGRSVVGRETTLLRTPQGVVKCDSGRARAPKRTGDYRDQQSLGLLLGFVAELVPDGCEGEPVQHSGRTARAEDQFRGSDAGQVGLQDPKRVRSDL